MLKRLVASTLFSLAIIAVSGTVQQAAAQGCHLDYIGTWCDHDGCTDYYEVHCT